MPLTEPSDLRGLLAFLAFTSMTAQPETLTPFPVCTDFDCDRRHMVELDKSDWKKIDVLFHGIPSAHRERKAIQMAIAELERLAGEQTDTWQDRARNEGDPADPGQLDCVAESINSTTYLNLLQTAELLQWHRVRERRSRNPWLFNYHWTAVIEEYSDGSQYAVDSWYQKNGVRPRIQSLAEWIKGRDPVQADGQ